LRCFERTRGERSARCLAFAAIESFDDGADEFVESVLSRRFTSAISSSNCLINSACAVRNSLCVPICSACESICLDRNRIIWS
jgi:hypothetical protein